MNPKFFPAPAAFRAWFEKHHRSSGELPVGFYKKGSGRPSITWPEAVDQALCFGWIDGVRRRLDDESYVIRFTPRRAGSTWSAVNIKRVPELESQGLMTPAGLEAFARRSEVRSRIYAYEQEHEATLEKHHHKALQANKRAWDFFQAQAPSYKRTIIHWIVRAKKEETRLKRLTALIEKSAGGRRL